MPYMNKPTDTPQEDALLTMAEAARMLKIHPVTLKRWAQAGTVTLVRLPVGNRPRITAAEVRRLMGKQTTEA